MLYQRGLAGKIVSSDALLGPSLHVETPSGSLRLHSPTEASAITRVRPPVVAPHPLQQLMIYFTPPPHSRVRLIRWETPEQTSRRNNDNKRRDSQQPVADSDACLPVETTTSTSTYTLQTQIFTPPRTPSVNLMTMFSVKTRENTGDSRSVCFR